jgi:hypothetical protein
MNGDINPFHYKITETVQSFMSKRSNPVADSDRDPDPTK